jgi:hypothetical protein
MKMIKKLWIIGFVLLLSITVKAQTQQQWAQTVHWDGVSHWSKYIIMLPAHMGPNALPVPLMGNGKLDNQTWIAATGQFNFMQGDHTQSICLYGNLPLAKDVVTLDASYIPKEFYQMSDTMKEQRHVYYKFWDKNKSRGDFILNVNIRLLKKWEKIIQLVMHIGYRYPSGNGFGSARYTDNMGYYFDVTAGKQMTKNFKWIAMAGFYCWQIDKEDLRQDDAFLFGTGFEWEKNKWKVDVNGSGYLGYLENQGDKPLIFRAGIEKRMSKISAVLKFQQGLHDFKYTTFEGGAKLFFK